MNLSESALNNRALVKFLIVVLIIGGVFSFFSMSKLEDPEIQVKQALVVTVYPGASAHQVELEVTDVLEKEIRAMGDIASLESKSMNDLSIITVELETTVPAEELEQRWDILRRRVTNAVPQLPDGCVAPVVKDDFGDVYGMFYAMTTDGIADEELVEYANLVKRELQDIDGVRRVEIYGDRKPCINIEFVQDKMANLGVHPAEVIATLNSQNKAVYSGYFTSGDRRLRVGVDDSYASIADIEDLIIQGHEDDQLRLGDVARISRGYTEPSRNEMRYDGARALGISVSMETGGNVITLGKEVDATLAHLKETRIPAGIDFEKVFFQPDRVKEANRDLYGQSGGIGDCGDCGADAYDGVAERYYHRRGIGYHCLGFFCCAVFAGWHPATGVVGVVDSGDGDVGGQCHRDCGRYSGGFEAGCPEAGGIDQYRQKNRYAFVGGDIDCHIGIFPHFHLS